jgi:hypothetical protein
VPTKHPEFFAALAAPIPAAQIRHKPGPGGSKQPYITARTVANRLDSVAGPENWQDDYRVISDHSVLGILSIRLPDGTWLTKQDAGGMSQTPDESDLVKSGFSDAFKRVAVKFGIAREIYRDGVAIWPAASPPPPSEDPPGVRFLRWVEEHGRVRAAEEAGRTLGFSSSIGAWTAEQTKVVYLLLTQAQAAPQSAIVRPAGKIARPLPADWVGEKAGLRFWQFLKDKEKSTGLGLMDFVYAWANPRGLKGKFGEWPRESLAEAYNLVLDKLAERAPQAVPPSPPPTAGPPASGPVPADVLALQEELLDLAGKIAEIQKPGKKLDGNDIALVVRGWHDLIPHGVHRINTVRGCTDRATLEQYVLVAAPQYGRLLAEDPRWQTLQDIKGRNEALEPGACLPFGDDVPETEEVPA